MVVHILSIVSGADTTQQGSAVFARLASEFARADQVTVSFEGIHTATSSFVNASLVPLLDRMSFDDVKRRLRVVNSTRQINEMIKTRLAREASRSPIAA